MIYITLFSLSLIIIIHSARKIQIALLLTKKFEILIKYLDFLNIFLKEKTLVLLELIKLNQYTIQPQNNKQSFYRPIHSLRLIKLEILKTYIKTNLVNSFI